MSSVNEIVGYSSITLIRATMDSALMQNNWFSDEKLSKQEKRIQILTSRWSVRFTGKFLVNAMNAWSPDTCNQSRESQNEHRMVKWIVSNE